MASIFCINILAQDTLRFISNGASGNMNDTILVSGQNIQIPECTFHLFGHKFSSWNTEADGSGNEFLASDSIMSDSVNIILYAQWQKYCGGNGSETNPWQICSKEALILLSNSPQDWKDHFIQTSDIAFNHLSILEDWNGDGDFNDLAGFSPIGSIINLFEGSYNGQSYHINHLYINAITDYKGLFGYVDGATIHNIVLDNAKIDANNYIGILVGKAVNESTISNVRCNGTLNGQAFIGGIVGSLEQSTMDNTSFMGDISAGGSMIGGLSGRLSESSLDNSYASGHIKGELQNVGGAVGFVQAGSKINNCYSSAGVQGERYVGGFAGILSGSFVKKCYATGYVSGLEYCEGFTGMNGSSYVEDCYFDKNTSWSVNTVSGCQALISDEFGDTNIFENWEFGNDNNAPWVLNGNQRPTLFWQTTTISNSIIANSDSGYVFKNSYVKSDSSSFAGIRYKLIDDLDWIYITDSVKEGSIDIPLLSLDEEKYLVQAIASDSNVTYYGDMTKLELYNLSFEANGGLGYMKDTLLASHDSTPLPLNTYYRLGYDFEYWSSTTDSLGQLYHDMEPIYVLDSSVLLQAIWSSRDFAIDYHLNGGTNSANNPNTYNVDSLIVFEDAWKVGYTFINWFTEDSFVTVIDSIPLASKQDTSLYAKWNINTYKLILHSNNGENDSIIVTDTFESTINLPLNSFENDDYSFKYWTNYADETGDLYYDEDLYTFGDSTLNLHAQWQRYCGGRGTKEEPWEICSKEALLLLSASPQDWDNYFIQTADINFPKQNTTNWDRDTTTTDSLGFSPIGNLSIPFTGQYNGQNFNITNLYIDRKFEDNIGFLGHATDTIKNVALHNVNINGQSTVGSLIGLANTATVYNCYANGLVTADTEAGGLIGRVENSILKNSYSTCGITAKNVLGGLVGYSSLSQINYCYSSGLVMSSDSGGGFIGNDNASFINSCYFDYETSRQLASSSAGDIIGINALSTADFKNTQLFIGWNIGIGIEILPWMPNENGRPYLIGQDISITNGNTINSKLGYTISEAYADSISFRTDSIGLRYKLRSEKAWNYITQVNASNYITTSFSNVANGDYLVQAFGTYGTKAYYGDMTKMNLRTLSFDANGGVGHMNDTVIIVGDSITFPANTYTSYPDIHSAWNNQKDAKGQSYSPKGKFAIGETDTILYAQWMLPFATDDYQDGIVGGATVALDITQNDTIGGLIYGVAFPIEIILTNTVGDLQIIDNQIVYSPPITFSGPDFFTYVVDYNGATDTAEVVVLVFDAPGNMVNSDCFIDMPKYQWEVESSAQSIERDIHNWTTPLVGDLYGDSYPEIVVTKGSSSFTSDDIAIYNGSATPLQSGRVNINNITTFNAAATTMAIAKINTSTGLQPTLFVADIFRKISAYNPENGNRYWQSVSTYCEELGNNEGAYIGVADFNNDGAQEIYGANSIFNAETGDRICTGGASTDIGVSKYGSTSSENYNSPSHYMMHSVTADFDRDGDLELAAGRYVFDVDIDNGQMPIMAQLPTNASSITDMIMDGSTVVADIDLDGDLDVIVIHQTTRKDFYCYVWDGQTPTLIAEKYIRNEFVDATRYGVGFPFIGDLNGDGKPEIAFTTSNRQYALGYNYTTTLQEYYTLEHSDKSGFTGLTLFDFNNDDIAEIVYRDETKLKLINASGKSHLTGEDTLNADGTPYLYNLAEYDCYSGTQSEFAVVVDIDLDDQAEIIVTNNGNGNRLNIFESGSSSMWVAARPVWNQYGYNVTNVNNDLTIPTYAINNSMTIDIDSTSVARPYNHFLQQMGNVTLTGENVIITPDLSLTNSYYTNDGTTGTLTFDIVNEGDAVYRKTATAVSFYCGDPYDGALLLAVDSIREDIEMEDTLFSQTYTFPADPTVCPHITVRLNDNGTSNFPDILNLQQECNYDNNTEIAAIFEITSEFSWNGFMLEGVAMNTGDTSDVSGYVAMLISRGDTVDLVPTLDGYVFEPDTITLENVQSNGSVSYITKKIPEIDFTPREIMYDSNSHAGLVTVEKGISYTTYYKVDSDSVWQTNHPSNADYYSMKIETEGNYLYTAYTIEVDSMLHITKYPLTFSLSVDDKNYDGTDSVLDYSAISNAIIGDDVALLLSKNDLKFAGILAGPHNIYPVRNWTLMGDKALNYELQPYDTVMANIYKQPLIIQANDSTKLYDGTHFSGGNGITVTGFPEGQDTSNLKGELYYDTIASSHLAKDQGTYAIIIGGFSSDNYDIQFKDGVLNIKKKFLFIEFRGDDVVNYADSIDLLDYDSPDVVNLAPGDTFIHNELAFQGDTSSSGHLEVGMHKLHLGEAYIQNGSGEDVTDNYDVSFSPGYISILQRELGIINAIPRDKEYDGNNEAVIDSAELSGLIEEDKVYLTEFKTGQFIQTDVGNDIEVFHNNTIAIFGADASNYKLIPFNTPLFADIFQKELVAINTIAHDKTYDGNNSATLSGTSLEGVVGNDNVYLLNTTDGLFAQSNTGLDINVATNMILSGTKKDNYYLTRDTTLVADITPKKLNIRAKDSSKVYDATYFYGGNDIECTGFVANEDTSNLIGTFRYLGTSQSAIDTGIYSIIPSGFTSTNYSISYTNGILDIDPRPLLISYKGDSIITYSDSIERSNYTVNNLANTDSIVLSPLVFGTDTSTSGHLNVGSHQLEIGNTYIINADSKNVNHNYTFIFDPSFLQVLPKELVVNNSVANDKIYDGNTKATIDSTTLVGNTVGDDIKLHNYSTGHFTTKDAGTMISVIRDSLYVSGKDVGNYTFITPTDLEADIYKRSVSYELDTIVDKIYDGTDTIINNVNPRYTDTVRIDSINLNYELVFETSQVGDQWQIITKTWELTGKEKHNYTLQAFAGDSASIKLKNLTIKAYSDSKTYDGVEYKGGNGIYCDGFINNEDTSHLLGNFNYIGTSQGAINSGEYTIIPSGFTSDNYEITFIGDTLTIGTKHIHIYFEGKDTITYGDSMNIYDYRPLCDELMSSDVLTSETLTFGIDTSYSGHLNIGEHQLQTGDIIILNEKKDTVTSNYIYTVDSSFIWVNPKTVTLVGGVALDKVYDKTTDAVIDSTYLEGLVFGDDIVLHHHNEGQFTHYNVGNNITVTPDSMSISGSDSANYILVQHKILEADILHRPISYVVDSIVDKYYDGTDTITNSISAYTKDAIVSDNIILNFKLFFENKNAGNDWQIIANEWNISGLNTNNYILSEYDNDSANILNRELNIIANDSSKIYDGSSFGGGAGIQINGFINNEDTNNLNGNLIYTGNSQGAINAGEYTITPAGFTSNNYSINYISDTLSILPKSIDVYFNGKDTITYGDIININDYQPISNELEAKDRVEADTLHFGNNTSLSGNLNIGEHQLQTDEIIILNETKDTISNNYILNIDTAYIWVNPKVVKVINGVADNKVYDKTSDAVISSAVLYGNVIGDDIRLISYNTGHFADVNVGQNITVTPDSVYISGTDSANYILTQPNNLAANITERYITYSLDTVANKIYDGTDTITNIVEAITNDTIVSDSITLHFQLAFENHNTGSKWEIVANQWYVTGDNMQNYILNNYSNDSASIFSRELNIIANDSLKTYDGNSHYGGNGISWNGFINSEDTSHLSGQLAYKGNAQAARDTGVYNITPSGFSSSNYTINYINGKLHIGQRPLQINYGGEDTVMYGDYIDMMNYVPTTDDLAYGDVIINDSLSFDNDTSSTGHLCVGTHALSIGEAYIANSEGDTVTNNYIFSFNPPNVIVIPKPLAIVEAKADHKTYDNLQKATISGAKLEEPIPGDDVFIENSEDGTFEDVNVGIDINVSTDSMHLQGKDKMNYRLLEQPALNANITPRPLYYTLDSIVDKTYDGTDSITNVVLAHTNDTIATDSIVLNFELSFEQHEAGKQIDILANAWSITGHDISNYALMPYDGDNADINKKDLTISTPDTARYYGEENPLFIIEMEGFIQNEDASVLDHQPTVSTTLNQKSFTGIYDDRIIVACDEDMNYNFIIDHGQLTIKKVDILVDFNAEDSLIYGESVDNNNYKIIDSNLANNDTLILGYLEFGTDTSTSGRYNVGEHDIFPGEINVLDEDETTDVTSNYNIIFNPSFITYTPKEALILLSAQNKIYDATTDAKVHYQGLAGIFDKDIVFLNEDSTDMYVEGTNTFLNSIFDDKNVGLEKDVEVKSIVISGYDRRNYALPTPQTLADITARSITLNGAANDKLYDGTTNAILDTLYLVGTILNDDIDINNSSSTFAQSDVGQNINVNVSGISLKGLDQLNYSLDTSHNFDADITKATLTVRPSNVEYTYGDSVPFIDILYEGFANNEDTSVLDNLPELITYLNPKNDIGYYTIHLGNGYDHNYSFEYQTSQGRINIRPLTIMYTGSSYVCANETIDLEAYESVNLVGGDTIDDIHFLLANITDNTVESKQKQTIDLHDIEIRNEIKKKVTDNYHIQMNTAYVETLVIPQPDLGDDLQFCGVCEYDFDAGEGISYLWSTGDTTRHISLQGNYRGYLWVQVENENNCFNTDSVGIAVSSKYMKTFISAYLYPNPNKGQFHVDLSSEVDCEAKIYDISGRLLKNFWVTGDQFDVDINLADGAYVLEVADAKEVFLVENTIITKGN